ncbi:DUF4401 domain-containing protein [Cupriavidus pauculus]|uniref:DUF4401 domain-containing protein n=1 Tax=Cupriavidus pauculus TaxID=82633 RepID=A0A2N5CG22_9BURK|nr:DUF4401 domain-containing protein [Cupriavidus pauculus]PLQ01189.1 DUF4401 domain-containing protein [Cupriavidus pauculus]
MNPRQIDRTEQTEQTERGLWTQLAARGTVQGDFAPTLRTPWPIRLLMGGAGWLGALFFQMFLIGTVFATTRGNGPAMAITGVVMIGIAVALYRVTARESGRIALGQFALALSLGGQGMAIAGVGEALGFQRFLETAPFWVAVALFEGVLFVLVPDRLHRFLAMLALWMALGVAACVVLGDLMAPRWTAIPMALGPMTALAFAALLAFVMREDRLAAAGRLPMTEPAADATLLMALLGALVVTGFAHPAELIFGVDTPWRAHGGWLAGALIGVALVAMTLLECRRLTCSVPVGAAMLGVAIAFSALMVYAPAVTAGVLALAVALRRGSLPWLGLGIATVLIGFVWYYSTLQWTLLAKSATLVAAGALLLAARAALGRIASQEAVA